MHYETITTRAGAQPFLPDGPVGLRVAACRSNLGYARAAKTIYLRIMQKGGIVYIVSSPNKSVLYTGVTSDLTGRIWKHKNKFYENSFTAKYNCVVLVCYKYFDDIREAIAEEKRIKAGIRAKK